MPAAHNTKQSRVGLKSRMGQRLHGERSWNIFSVANRGAENDDTAALLWEFISLLNMFYYEASCVTLDSCCVYCVHSLCRKSSLLSVYQIILKNSGVMEHYNTSVSHVNAFINVASLLRGGWGVSRILAASPVALFPVLSSFASNNKLIKLQAN